MTDGAPPGDEGAFKLTPRRGMAPDAVVLRRVRWRLVAWSAGATLVVLVILGALVYGAVSGSLASDGRQVLEARAATITRFLLDPRILPDQLTFGISIGGPTSGTFAFLIGPDSQALGPSDLSLAGLPVDASVDAARAGAVDVRESTAENTPIRVLSEAVDRAGQTYVVQVVQDISAERRLLDVLVTVLLAGGLLAVMGATVVGAIYAGRALVPIRESLRRQREFAADASHEFRNPLAVISASVQHLERHRDEPVGAVGEALDDIRDEVEHLTALVGDLLLLARTDSGVVELESLPLDLADVAAEALGAAAPLAGERGVELALDPEPAPTVGDALRLRQLVTILVDNAIRHSPGGGTVTVRVRSSAGTASGTASGTATGAATMTVEDQGPGIRPEDMPHIFDRFWRAPGAPAGGTGLGLSIAAWIVERHHGTISVATRPEGGARFEVVLPAKARR